MARNDRNRQRRSRKTDKKEKIENLTVGIHGSSEIRVTELGKYVTNPYRNWKREEERKTWYKFYE